MTAARLWATVALLCGLWAKGAEAHELGLSRSVWRPIDAHTWAADLTLAAAEVISVVDSVTARTTLTRGGAPCISSWAPIETADEDGVRLQARFDCVAPTHGASLEVDFGSFDALRPGHRHLAQVFDGQDGAAPITHVLQASAARFLITSPHATSESAAAPPVTFSELVVFGVEHIVFGFDHLVFLFGLILVGGRWRDLFAVVTAFTAAHSITLGLAALGGVAPPSAVVEAAIAASIVYVGVENYFVQSATRRWRLTFAFGLVHGFGFAGALAEIGVRGTSAVCALLGFNLGVELGQLALVAVTLPALAWARRSPRFVALGVPCLSGLVVALGLWWFIERV